MTVKAMILIFTALVLAQAALVAPFSVYPGDMLIPLCKGRNTNLTTRKNFEALLRQREKLFGYSPCSRTIQRALLEFKKVLGQPKDNVCSMEKVREFKAFFREFLDNSKQNVRNRAEAMVKLPKSLRHFVVAYGMQVSNLCKKNMIEALNEEWLMKEVEEDFAPILEVTDREGGIETFIKLANGPADLLMPTKLALIYKRAAIQEELKVQFKDEKQIRLIETICERRFRPVYEQVVMPMTELASIGINYKDKLLRDVMKDERVAANFAKWSKAVFLCELFKVVEVTANLLASDEETAGIKVIDSKEAQEVKRTTLGSLFQLERQDEGEFHRILELNYSPRFRGTLDEVVFNKVDAKLFNRVFFFRTEYNDEMRMIPQNFKIALNSLTHKVGRKVSHLKLFLTRA